MNMIVILQIKVNINRTLCVKSFISLKKVLKGVGIMPLGLSALNIHLHISLGFCILRHWETVHVVSNVTVPQCLVILVIKNFISRHKIQPRKPYLNK